MQEIHVQDWKCIRPFTPPSKEFILKEVVDERSVINVSVSVLCCSCDIDLLNSAYLTTKGTIIFGEASSAVDRSFELALSSIKEGEKTIINIEIAGKYVNETLRQRDVNLKCEVIYAIIVRGRKVYQYSDKEKLDIGLRYKELALYKLGNATTGTQSYIYPTQISVFFLLVRAVAWLSIISSKNLTQHDLNTYTTLKNQCYNNISYFHLVFANYEKAVSSATIVLSHAPDNTKALYRRAVGNTNLQNYESAYSDLLLVIKKEPSNSSARKQMSIVSKHIKSVDKIYAQAMKKFLSFK